MITSKFSYYRKLSYYLNKKNRSPYVSSTLSKLNYAINFKISNIPSLMLNSFHWKINHRKNTHKYLHTIN